MAHPLRVLPFSMAVLVASGPALLAQTCYTSAPYGTGSAPIPVATADMNRDGAVDLVVGCNVGTVQVLLNDGHGAFGAPATYSAGPSVYGVAAGDLDGDGWPDVVIAPLGSGATPGTELIVRMNDATGSGGLGPPVSLASRPGPVTVLIADLDGDGDNDIAVDNFYDNSVAVYDNNGAAGGWTLTPLPRIDVQTRPQGLAFADLNGDGVLDLIATNIGSDSMTVRMGGVSGVLTYGPAVQYPTGHEPYYCACADFNGDHVTDVAVIHYNGGAAGSVRVFINDGAGVLSPQELVGLSAGPLGIVAADLDRDGDVDLAISCSGGSRVSVLYKNSAGAFASPVDLLSPTQLYTLTCADLNGDAAPDLAAAGWGQGAGQSVEVFLNSAACGPADVGGQGGVPVACGDGHLDNNDFVVFIGYFFEHTPRADVGRTGGVPGADGAFDNNDFVIFIDQFFSGCG